MKKLVLAASTVAILLSQTACFGSFELTKTLYEWNDGVTENKFVKTLVFYGMSIIPVYAIGVFADVIILNLIEFWSGSNPMAMNEGELEEQMVMYKGDMYKITATKNKFSFAKVDGKELKDLGSLAINDEQTSWFYIKDDKSTEIINFKGEYVNFATKEGFQTVDYSLIEESLNNDNLALK